MASKAGKEIPTDAQAEFLRRYGVDPRFYSMRTADLFIEGVTRGHRHLLAVLAKGLKPVCRVRDVRDEARERRGELHAVFPEAPPWDFCEGATRTHITGKIVLVVYWDEPVTKRGVRTSTIGYYRDLIPLTTPAP